MVKVIISQTPPQRGNNCDGVVHLGGYLHKRVVLAVKTANRQHILRSPVSRPELVTGKRQKQASSLSKTKVEQKKEDIRKGVIPSLDYRITPFLRKINGIYWTKCPFLF